MAKWVSEWPTERGEYWFYGHAFRSQKESGAPPQLYFVKVRGTAEPKKFVYVTNGHFLYAEEGAEGVWQAVKLPDLPSELGQAGIEPPSKKRRKSEKKQGWSRDLTQTT